MRQQKFHLAALTAAAALLLAAQAHAVKIEVGMVSGAAGSTQSLSVTLSSEGSMVAGTQNDIAFEAGAPINAVNGQPDCAVNAAIMKTATTFAFQPSGCSGATCTGVRSLVLSFSNTAAIPDGSVLYTCNIAIGASATGTLPLTCANAGASDPSGNALTTTCTNGSVTVGGGGGPTPTPTGGASSAIIHVGSASGASGATVSVDVTLETPLLGTMVAGTQNDIAFEAAAPINAVNGQPDCTVNSAINKTATTFAFQPSGCGGTSGTTCTGVRALVLSFSNTSAIPSGSVLYTCNITIGASASGSLPLTCSNAGASDPGGNALTTTCTNGAVMVGTGGTPTSSPTATPSPTKGGVGTPTATVTGKATSTRTPIVGPTAPFFKNDDDACAIVPPASGHFGWTLLLPAAVLLWLRRRSR
jgi:hypothetical protein